MKDLGKGLGTCGIWLGIGILGWNNPEMGAAASGAGMFATLFIWYLG